MPIVQIILIGFAVLVAFLSAPTLYSLIKTALGGGGEKNAPSANKHS